MKPRIKLIARFATSERWSCEGCGWYDIGRTPEAAYWRWEKRVKAARELAYAKFRFELAAHIAP